MIRLACDASTGVCMEMHKHHLYIYALNPQSSMKDAMHFLGIFSQP